MTLKEKLEFLAKHSDGSEFAIQYTSVGTWRVCNYEDLSKVFIENLELLNFREIINPKYTLTEDEKAIVRNIDDKWKYIHRTNKEIMFIATCNADFNSKNNTWNYENGHYFNRFPYAEKIFSFIGHGQSVLLDELREIAREN